MSEPAVTAINRRPTDHVPHWWDTVMVATAASATVLLFSPANVYYPNALEFPLRFRDALPYLFLLTATAAALTAGLVCMLKRAWRGRAVSLLLGVAVLAWLQGNVLTWSYGRVDGRDIDWSGSAWRGWVDGGVWVVVLLGVTLGWRKAIRHSRAVAIALLGAQFVAAGIVAWTSDAAPSYMLRGFDYDVAYRLSSRRNVVVLVLDSLQGTEFAPVIAADPTLVSGFDGFTYFRNAVADFPMTQGSVPAILTARRYDNSQSCVSFIQAAYDGPSSIPKLLKQRGFIVDVFGLSKAIWADPTVLSNLASDPTGLRTVGANLAFLVDLGLFRCMPHQLKRAVYADQSWLFLRLAGRFGLERRTPMAIAHIASNASFVSDLTGLASNGRLESDPAFKFFHVQGPHPPLSIDEAGRPAELALNADNYRRAVAGSIKVAGLLVDLLRRRGLYDESLILVLSTTEPTSQPCYPPTSRPQRVTRPRPAILAPCHSSSSSQSPPTAHFASRMRRCS